MSSLSNTAIEMRLSLLESGTSTSGGSSTSAETASNVVSTSSDGSEIVGTNLYVAYATSVIGADTFGKVPVQSAVQGFRLSRDIAFDESGDVLPWVGLLTSSSPFQSEDPVDYIWSNATTGAGVTSAFFVRYYTLNPGLAAFIGDPDNPGDGIYWQEVPASGEIPSAATWMVERYTIGGSNTSWQLRPLRVSENFLPFVKYSKVGTAPILNTSTWDEDVIEAVADQTGLPYSNIRELGYGTVVVVDYDDGTSQTGVLKQVNGLDVWEPPGEMIPGNLVVDGTIAGDKIQANSITSDQIGANEINANHLEVGAVNAQAITIDGNIHIQTPEEGYCLNTSYTDKVSCEGIGSTWVEEYSSGLSAGEYTTGYDTFLYPDGSADRPLPSDSSIFLGLDNLEEIAEINAKFFVGNKDEYISWNGKKLTIGGNIVTSGNIQSMDGSKIILATYKLDGRVSGPNMSNRVNACIAPVTASASGEVLEFDIDIIEETFDKNLVPVVNDANGLHMDNGWSLEYGKLGSKTGMYTPGSGMAFMYDQESTIELVYKKQEMLTDDWTPMNGLFVIRKADFPFLNFQLRLSVNPNFSTAEVGFNAFAGGLSETITVDLDNANGTTLDLTGYGFTKIEAIQATPIYGLPHTGQYCYDGGVLNTNITNKVTCEDYEFDWVTPWMHSVVTEFIDVNTIKLHGFTGTTELGAGRLTVSIDGY